ncbi:MAG: BatD family protein, partial [Candidatus Goldiibacteriota bacterium]
FEGFRQQGSYSNSMMNFVNGSASSTNQFIIDLIAVKTGDIVIPPAKVKFMDPATKKYTVEQTKEITVTVDSGKRHVIAADTPVPQPTAPPPAVEDIRSIKYSVHLDFSELLPYIILAIIFIIAVYFIWKRIMKKEAPKAAVIDEDYRRDALRRVKGAAGMLKKGDVKGYYSEIYEAYRWFLTRHFRDSFDEHTTQEILKKLSDKKAAQADMEASAMFMKDCDLVKFADLRPSDKEIEAVSAAAEKLISEFK